MVRLTSKCCGSSTAGPSPTSAPTALNTDGQQRLATVSRLTTPQARINTRLILFPRIHSPPAISNGSTARSMPLRSITRYGPVDLHYSAWICSVCNGDDYNIKVSGNRAPYKQCFGIESGGFSARVILYRYTSGG